MNKNESVDMTSWGLNSIYVVFQVKGSYPESNHEKTPDKSKLQNKWAGLFKNVILMRDKTEATLTEGEWGRLMTTSTAHDPRLGPVPGNKNNCHKGHYWDNWQSWNMDCRLNNNLLNPLSLITVLFLHDNIFVCRKYPLRDEGKNDMLRDIIIIL